MVFHDINGLTESRTFSDLWQYVAKNPTQMKCPICKSQCYRHQAWTGFNMNKVGKITFKCMKQDCDFNTMDFTIEAIAKQ